MALTKITPQMFDTSAADHDFNIDNGTFVVDASANRVGIGTATPSTLLDVNGVLTAGSIAVDNITIDGTEIDLSSGSLTLDVATNIILDSGNAEMHFAANGTVFGKLYQSGNDFYINNPQSDEDIIFTGNDGGSTITALTLDMSEAGAATFNSTVTAPNIKATTEFQIFAGGTDIGAIFNSGGALTIQGTSTRDVSIGSDSVTNAIFVEGTNGNVGIGTQPIALDGNAVPGLTISSNGPFILLQDANNADKIRYISNNTGEFQFGIVNDNGATSKTEHMRVTSNGKVGIGETIPLGQLHVKTGDSGATADTSADEFVVEGSGNAGISILSGASNNGSIYFGDSTVNYDGYIAYSQANRQMTVASAGGGNYIKLDETGHVGFSSTPTAWSSGYKSIQIGNRGFVAAHTGSDLYVGQNAYIDSGWKYEASVAASVTQHSGGQITHKVAAAGTAGNVISWIDALHIKTDGKVGIGTTSPAYTLTVEKSVTGDWLSRIYNTGTAEGDMGVLLRTGSEHDGTSILSLYSGSSYKFKFQADGKLGIGTTSPSAPLHIQTNDSTTNTTVTSLMITNLSTGTTTTGFGGEIRFQAERNNGVNQNTGGIRSVAEVNSGTNISSGMAFDTSTAGVNYEKMRINSGQGIFCKEVSNNGDYSMYIGSICAGGNGNRYAHVQLGTAAGDMYWVEVVGFDYSANSVYGRAGGYVYNFASQTPPYSSVYNGSIVNQFQNTSGYVEIVIDTGSNNTSNRWGSYVLRGGTDTITASGSLEILQYSYTSTAAKVY